MFAGIIQQIGIVVSCEIKGEQSCRLVVSSAFENIEVGESIAVNGVCLTVLPDSSSQHMMFDLTSETVQLTNLVLLKAQDKVHVERALLANDRIGGHYLTGHVDGLLTLQSKCDHDDGLEMVWTGLTPQMQAYVFPKGCIALAGVSLTINVVQGNTFSVMLIPHTLVVTQLKMIEVGESINVECDYFAKMIAQQMKHAIPLKVT